ncbi:MAG: amino acid permease [Steroidobacteraceae bacterium]
MSTSIEQAEVATEALQRGSLGWFKVAALGVAIAISGNFSGWNYGLGVGGWGGMLVAALGMALLFFILTQCLAELAGTLPQGGGFDFYARYALGPAAGYLAGMSVAVALAVGTGLAASFAEAYTSAMLGIGGWPVKIGLFVAVIALQMRGAAEAVGLTMGIGITALVILVVFCLFLAPHFDSANLLSAAAAGGYTAFPHGALGAAQCIPFALFLFLGVEQAAHAASEMKDVAKLMPRALLAAISVAFAIGFCVLLFATGSAGADHLATANDPLYVAIAAHPDYAGTTAMERLVASGALISLIGTFFSLAYAGSRQFYHLAGAGYLPHGLHRTNRRLAPARALLLVAAIGLVAAAFSPDSVMVVFIFLISVSYVLVLLAFIHLRRRQPALVRPYRAFGGQTMAVVATVLAVAVMLSCYHLQAVALSYAVAALAALAVYFRVFKPGSR